MLTVTVQKGNVLFKPEYECVKALNCFSILCAWWSIKDREQVNEQTNERKIQSERMGQLVTKCNVVLCFWWAFCAIHFTHRKCPKYFHTENISTWNMCMRGREREKRSRLKMLGILCTLKCEKIVDFATYALSLSWHEYFG